MLSRALSLAAVTLLIGCFATPPAGVQAQNLEAGKSPSQIFAGTCNACHKGPRGLLKTVSAGSLPGFLRQHYTTSADMASLLSTFLISNGAGDTRYQAKQGADKKPAGGSEQLDRQGRRLRSAPAEEAAKPDADGPPQDETGRRGRNAKRMARPGELPDAAKPAVDAPAQASRERGPDGRKLTAKQRLSKRGRPGGEEPPRTEELPKSEPGIDDKAKAESVKDDNGKPEGIKPAGEGKSEAAKIEEPKESGSETLVLRPDPVPPVTPAPPAASSATSTTASSQASEPPSVRPSTPSETPAAVSVSPPPAPSASPPPAPPVAAAGPPAPPISQ
jgi:hypothetical protein